MIRVAWVFCFFVCFIQTGFPNNGNGEAENIKGLQLLDQNKPQESETCFRQAIAENKKVKYYYNNLAVSLMMQKRYNEAIIELNKAIIIDSLYVKAVSNIAVCYFYLKDYKNAYRYYKIAKEINTDYVNDRFNREKLKEKTRDMKIEGCNENKIDELINVMTNN